MAEQLQKLIAADEVRAHVDILRGTEPSRVTARDALSLVELDGGLLQFTERVFPGIPQDAIYGEVIDREPTGRGAHFDIYDARLNPDYPWLGIYNLAGEATVKAAMLPSDLAENYNQRFPDPDKEAREARRDYSAIALRAAGVEVLEGELHPGTGMMLFQHPGVYVIHDIVPKDGENPGRFVKLVHPADNEPGRAMVQNKSLLRLDELTDQGLAGSQSSLDLATLAERVRDVTLGYGGDYSDCDLD